MFNILFRFFPTPLTARQCEVPCPQNCVLSVFGDWSKCTATCGNGTQYRVSIKQ